MPSINSFAIYMSILADKLLLINRMIQRYYNNTLQQQEQLLQQ